MSIQIVEGVAYLHNCRPPILHRDLKSANILLNGHFDCKISDFGLSRLMQHEASMSTVAGVSAKAVAGTPVYMPPESLLEDPTPPASPAGDMYSLGVLLWELWTGEVPWNGRSIPQIIRGGRRCRSMHKRLQS